MRSSHFLRSEFQLQLARATQRLYYPEFLPDDNRPPGLPWGSVGDGKEAISESWGTLRFGRLAEILLYDVRRTCTLAGPSAPYTSIPRRSAGCWRARHHRMLFI